MMTRDSTVVEGTDTTPSLDDAQPGELLASGSPVGVDRTGPAEVPKAHGADVVVQDLGELLGWR